MVEVDKRITERIYIPVVSRVYEEWKKRGLLEETVHFLDSLPTYASEPIKHSFITHVHKEKGLFIDLIGESFDVPETLRKPLALSADILWALALMIDDIQDNDITRGGLESSWAKFGKKRSAEAVHIGLSKLTEHLAESLGDETVAASCMQYVAMGVRSLTHHKNMSLETPIGEIIRNYEERCDFHGIFQLSYIFERVLKGQQPMKQDRILAGMRYYYRGGQIINDLKDLVEGDLYSRSHSDLRNGIPTIPLADLYRSVSKYDAKNLEKMFGNNTLNFEQKIELGKMVKDSALVPRVFQRIADCYATGIDLLSDALPSDLIIWFQRWAKYKLNFLNQATGS